jgi:F420-non-reducing hydrogenase iron-sulfur subunit
MMRHFLPQMGIEASRLRLVWASAAEGNVLAESITQFVDEVRKLGPLHWADNWEEDGERLTALEEIVHEHAEAMEVPS